MSPVQAPSAALEVAEMIERLRMTIAASWLADAVLLRRGEILQEWAAEADGGRGASLELPRVDGGIYTVDGLQIIRFLEAEEHQTDFTRAQFIAAISLVGDALRRNSFFNQQRPEFDFFRLLRKAVNHGNRWRFQGNPLPRKAEFNGIVLSKALADKPVLFDTLGPGDVFDLFDAIAARLRTIA